jgi:hypothetical protein
MQACSCAAQSSPCAGVLLFSAAAVFELAAEPLAAVAGAHLLTSARGSAESAGALARAVVSIALSWLAPQVPVEVTFGSAQVQRGRQA